METMGNFRSMANAKVDTLIRLVLSFVLAIATILFNVAFSGCSNDEGDGPIQTMNKPPKAFNLIGVTDGTAGVELSPSLSWKMAIDPDGDAVTYDLYIDTETNPTKVYAGNLTGTFFQVQERLSLSKEYFWRVVAKDDKGNTTESATYKFTTRNLNIPSTAITEAPNFTRRTRHSTEVFDNKLWVIGGRSVNSQKNDVWSSTDGSNWTEATQEAAFSEREGHATAVFDNRLWVIGGYHWENGNNYHLNDLWFSTDGENWTDLNQSAPFSKRLHHTLTAFDNKLWVIAGGGETAGLESDVWYSSNGTSWIEATSTAAFSGRWRHATAVFDNKLWVVGGQTNLDLQNDVWFSSDGVNWTEATPAAAFSRRMGHSMVVFDAKLWIIGGWDGSNKNDIWYSEDGITWVEAVSSAHFPERSGHTSAVFDNRMCVIDGGWNDVWAMD